MKTNELKGKKEQNFFDQAKKILRKNAENSSFHGINWIIGSKSILSRIFWSTFLAISTSFAIFFIFQIVTKFLEYEVVTNIKNIYEGSSDFPDVSFCDLNKFSTKAGIEFYQNKTKEFFEYVDLKRTDYSLNKVSGEKMIMYNSEYSMNMEFLLLNETLQKNIINSLENMLILCIFNGYPCSFDDFIWFYDTYYGSCFKFNTKLTKNSKIYLPGFIGGLEIDILLGDRVNSSSNGLHIFVNNNTFEPRFTEGIDIPPSKKTNIGVARTFDYKLKSPKYKCITDTETFDSDLYRFTVAEGKRYRQIDCFDNCAQNKVISKCSCFIPTYSNLNRSTIPCATPSLVQCAYHVYNSFRIQLSLECSSFCPLECQKIDYTFTLSSFDYLGQDVLDYVQIKHPNSTKQEITNRLISFRVYYPELKYTSISQVFTTDIWGVVTSIGGAFGLFMGGSLLSILEIFYGTIDVIGHIIKRPIHPK